MNWCDMLASTPTVGLGLTKFYCPSADLLSTFTERFDHWSTPQKANFQIGTLDAFTLEVTSDDGYHYYLDPGRISVEFRHRLKLRTESAGPPTVEMLSKPQPYSLLMADAIDNLKSTYKELSKLSPRKIERIGIVTTTNVIEDDLPPGIRKLIKHIASPWQDDYQAFNFELTATLNKINNQTDRCTHHILRKEDGLSDIEKLVTLRLDWQRVFDTPLTVTGDSLSNRLSEATTAALLYFEDMGVGDRFDVSGN